MRRFAALVLLMAMCGLLALTSAQKSTENSYSVLSEAEKLREDHEWPEDIVQTGERTGLGTKG